jgi:hypothetical protein
MAYDAKRGLEGGYRSTAQTGGQIMSFAKLSTLSRVVGAIAAGWFCGIGAAWAGGSADLGSLQSSLNTICDNVFGMTACPQLPTITQVILELAGLENLPPDYQRGNAQICDIAPGNSTQLPQCSAVALNAVNPPTLSGLSLPNDLYNMKPLGFVSALNKTGPAVPAGPSTSGANSFFYAAAVQSRGQAQTLNLVYDYPPQTSSTFDVEISLPLQMLNSDGSESLVTTSGTSSGTLMTVHCAGATCSSRIIAPPNLVGRSAADLGVTISPAFGPSPNSDRAHAILQVQVPLLVTGPAKPAQCGKDILSNTPDPASCGNDPAYFGVDGTGDKNTGNPTYINQLSGLPTFTVNDLGFTPGFLGTPVGIAPYAAPPCGPNGAKCSNPLPSNFQTTFPFCASFSLSGALRQAVTAFYSIGTDSTTYVSAPTIPQPPPPAGVTPPRPSQCPF